MKLKLKAVGHALVVFSVSPQARRYEIPLAIATFEAIRASLGHA